MIELSDKKICESCFCETGGEEVCPHCGFNVSEYTPDPMVLPLGTKLNDKIIIGRVMGKGGFGITYLGYDLRMDKIIAVKEYYPSGISYRAHMGTELSVIDPKASETFEQGAQKFYTEAEMVSQFNGNPNIMGVYDYFRANNTVYLIMEYLSGMTLKNYVKKHGKLTDGQALYVMDKIAAALSITHSAGVLHRDISPDNIMICADGKVKLIDFGAARQILTESSSNLTVVMKPGYTPIEQYTKKGKQGAWTDIYSLGVSVYYALTEVVLDDPYSRMDGDNEFDENKHDINGSIWEILKKCTMINALERYGSAIDLRKALKSVSAPLTAEAIAITEEDLKQQSQGDMEEVQTELNPEEASASESVDNPAAAEEIETFEEEKESPDKSEKSSEADSKDADKIQPKGGKLSKGRKKTVPIICACAGLAAAAVLCFVFIPNVEKAPDDIPTDNTHIPDNSVVTTSKDVPQETANTEDYPEMNDGKLYLKLDTEYPGNWQSGKTISKQNFLRFDSDVKVTLHFEYIQSLPEAGHVIEFRDLNSRKVDIMAFNNGIKCEDSDGNWYDILPGMEFFSFVVSREAINDMIASLSLRVENLIVKSAVLEEYDPSEYEPGEDALTVSIDSREYWHGSNFIPKETLESFGSNVRVALDIEYESMDPKKEDLYVNINVCDENWNFVDVTAENIVNNPPESGLPQYMIGFRDLPDIFTFTITKEQIAGLTDKGLMFNSSNVYIKSAALEPVKVTVKFDGKYPGDWRFQKKGIEKEQLQKFGGDVEVTLYLKNIEPTVKYSDIEPALKYSYSDKTKYLQLRDGGLDSPNTKRIPVTAINKGPDYPEEETDSLWYNMYYDGQETFTFIISRDTIDSINNSLYFGVVNMVVESAVLKAYNPEKYKAGSDAVIVNIDCKKQWDDSPFIPKKTFLDIGGDVRVVLDIEYTKTNDEYPPATIMVGTYNPRDYCPLINVENTAPNIYRTDCTAYYLGCEDVPDKFIFTISEEEINKLGEQGMFFCSENLYIKTAALEAAE